MMGHSIDTRLPIDRISARSLSLTLSRSPTPPQLSPFRIDSPVHTQTMRNPFPRAPDSPLVPGRSPCGYPVVTRWLPPLPSREESVVIVRRIEVLLWGEG